MSAPPFEGLATRIDGELQTSLSARRRASRDFGGMFNVLPGCVVRPRDAEDASRIFEFGREKGIDVRLRGAGHSVAGQTLTDGIVLSTTGQPTSTVRLLNDNTVEISGGHTWMQVEQVLSRHGLQIGVLADHLGLSVGGTLSVGGYGADSVSLGPQTDLVQRLHVVQRDGTPLWCSPREHPEVFRRALAGMGQAGLIDRVVIRTEQRAPFTALATQGHSNLVEMIDSLQPLADGSIRPHLFKALAARGRHVATYGAVGHSRREARERLPKLTRVTRRWNFYRYRDWRNLGVRIWTGSMPLHTHQWADYLMPYPSLVRFATFLGQLQEERPDFARHLQAVFVLGVRRQQQRSAAYLEASSGFDDDMIFGIGLYSMVRRTDSAGQAAVSAALRECQSEALRLGARPYLYGWHQLSDPDVRALYNASQFPASRLMSQGVRMHDDGVQP